MAPANAWSYLIIEQNDATASGARASDIRHIQQHTLLCVRALGQSQGLSSVLIYCISVGNEACEGRSLCL